MDNKALANLLKTLRKNGVIKFKTTDLELEISHDFLSQPTVTDLPSSPPNDPEDPWKDFPQGTLTPEQLMFYSAGGIPGNDPDNKD
jgi:hypothetical protein